jgi:hypothetical protein
VSGPPRTDPGRRPTRSRREQEERIGLWLQFAFLLALEASFVVALYTLWKFRDRTTISGSQKVMFEAGFAVALVFFGLRAWATLRRLRGRRPPAP